MVNQNPMRRVNFVKSRRLRYGLLVAIFLVFIFCALSVRIGNINTEKAVNYTVMQDSHETTIAIGVDKAVNREQLSATLAKAANEHQYDGRDYYLRKHLVVKAYLTDRYQQSTIPAGVLIRYVPPFPSSGKKTDLEPAKDFLLTTLVEANLEALK